MSIQALRAVRTIRLSTRSVRMVERNAMALRHNWMIIFSGFVEPVLYLLGIGFGIGSLVKNVPLGDHSVSYAVFVAPALMASSAMNGAIYESTFNLFYKLRYARTFEAVISTPVGVEDATLGEVVWAIGRGSLYSVGFVVVMLALGLVASPWAILAVPGAILVGFAFASLGAAVTTFVRQWQDLDTVQLALQPMFLFSATFFPVTVYPPTLRLLVEWTPLYRGIDLIRGLTTGLVGPALLGDVAYLVVMGVICVTVASLRLRGRLLK